MKLLLVFIGLIGITLATAFPEVQTFDPQYRNNFHGEHLNHFKSLQTSHYVQHEDTVAQAKSKVQEKLSQMRAQDGGASGRTYSSGGYTSGTSGGNYRYSTGCQLCDQSSSSNLESYSSRSSSGLSNSDYSGVGTVGVVDHLNKGESSRYSASDDVQTFAPVRSNSRTSASKLVESYDAEDFQRPEYPVMGRDQQAYTGSSYTAQRNFGSAVPSQSEIDVSHHSSAANSEVSEGSSYSQRRPVYTGHVQQQQIQRGQQSSSSETRTAPVITIPVRITPANGQQYSSSRSEFEESSSTRTQPTYSVLYRAVPYSVDQQGRVNQDRIRSGITTNTIYVPQPVQVNAEKYVQPIETDHNNLQTVVQPELTNYNSFGNSERSESSRTNSRAESSQTQRVNEPSTRYVYTPSRPSDGGSSRYASNVNSNLNNFRHTTHVQPARPLEQEETDRTSSASRQDSSYRQTSRTSSDQESRYQGGQSYYDTPAAGSSTQQRISSGSRVANTNRYNQLPAQLYPTGDRLSSRHGTGTHESQSSLDEFMTESERLAKLQSRTVAGSSSNTQSSSSHNVDTLNRIAIEKAATLDSNAAEYINRNSHLNQQSGDSGLPPGYKKVTSWQKQSKWASGSNYGPDGKLKTHSMLSTAEGEQHNINGDEVGYKAATTTLEDDGKVSTYSLHS